MFADEHGIFMSIMILFLVKQFTTKDQLRFPKDRGRGKVRQPKACVLSQNFFLPLRSRVVVLVPGRETPHRGADIHKAGRLIDQPGPVRGRVN